MEINDVMSKAAKYAGLTAAAIHSDTPENNRLEESAYDELCAAILALVARARDEEAEDCALVCEDFDACSPQYIARAIRARIAARKGE